MMLNAGGVGFWPRAAAFALDYLVISAYIAFLVLASWLVSIRGNLQAIDWIFANPALFDLFAFLVLTVPVVLYFALLECSSYQATWGKRRLRLAVTGMDGKRINLGRSLLRSGMKFLPWQISHTSLFHIPGWPFNVQVVPIGPTIGFGVVWLLVLLYLVMLAFGKHHRPPYDRLAGTMVTSSYE